MPQAVRLLERWHARFDIDFVEAPVPIDPVELMRDLAPACRSPLCANEGLWREADACRVIDSRCGDDLCFSRYWVGTLRRFQRSATPRRPKGWQVCKHTHGELGIAAAAAQHVLLTLPNAGDGHQQTAQIMADDILTEPLPIATRPALGPDRRPGLGVEVDEAKLARYHRRSSATASSCPTATGSPPPSELLVGPRRRTRSFSPSRCWRPLSASPVASAASR